ncbi:nineteen complex-related protein 2-domain-containing protein [Massariosphaeria phaeospora]|uniref:Nineteen complex-related protein 2-domain-containing protein n=1 Tax=Massariosphaeria phaeospora TaxID=100035 RepID=A0A7C8M3N8_9PLEO|nr:nineteen complex-related protein 2-domain-containing protein [Massariosphaeria phaeospora]
MRRTGSGRIARKVGAYDADSEQKANSSQREAQDRSAESVVKRPTFGKAKKRSSLRVSYGPGESDGNDADESSDATVVTPRKSNLSRIAIEKNAQIRSRSPLVPVLPRESIDEERPTYSQDYIAELRNSTPSTPKDLIPTSEEQAETRALDIASKFGPVVTITTEATTVIPTDAEIQEKKARRKRLAKEYQAYDEDEDRPWASDDDDEFRTSRNEISLRPKEKYTETRLVRDDEDIMEGFDDFVEDGKISLGRKSEREAERRRRTEMADLIQNAERRSDDDSPDYSEEERNDAFTSAQARAGTYSKRDPDVNEGAMTPPRLPPLPDLDEVLESLDAHITAKEQRKEAILVKLKDLEEDKVRIAERKQYIQVQLKKTAEEYDKMRQDQGKSALAANGDEGGSLMIERGLESLGATLLESQPSEDSSEDSEGG